MSRDIRFGYSAWGFLSDYKITKGKEVSTPDGNATYSWSILWEAHRRGWETFWLQQDRDIESYEKHGEDAFSSFSSRKRLKAYLETEYAGECHGEELPDLDILLVEWRWPIPGRNTEADRASLDFQPDLMRQTELLHHYKERGTKIVIWDLDHKLEFMDETKWEPDAIFETSVTPRHSLLTRTRVEPPIVVNELLQHEMKPCDPCRKLVYVGSRYERDDVIAQYVKPVSDRFPTQVEFWGNWRNEPNLTQCREMWPNILYCPRITPREFGVAYGTAVACPLLAKRGYLKTGFVTPRIWEALLFGTIPIGLEEHNGIDQYLTRELIVQNGAQLAELTDVLSKTDQWMRERIRTDLVDRLGFMDVKFFADKLEAVLG